MSALEIYKVTANGDVVHEADARNSFGGAMHIWLTLARKYHIRWSILDPGSMDAVWHAWPRMSERDAWVMRGTFDHVIIPREQLPRYLGYLTSFVAEYPSPTLREALAVLERLAGDATIRGVCFNQTSVNADAWEAGADEPDEAGNHARVYNVDRETDHWWLTPESFNPAERSATPHA